MVRERHDEKLRASICGVRLSLSVVIYLRTTYPVDEGVVDIVSL